MTIKEVEKITGLTAKSIRLYEQKGLLEVDRNQGNDYREYTEENVQTLKWIKLYRYLEFSLEEIKELLNGDEAFRRSKLEEKHQCLEGKKECVERDELSYLYLLPNHYTLDYASLGKVYIYFSAQKPQAIPSPLYLCAALYSIHRVAYHPYLCGIPCCKPSL